VFYAAVYPGASLTWVAFDRTSLTVEIELSGDRESGSAILLATHDLFRAKEDASRIGIMQRGRLVHELAGTELGHAELEGLYLEVIRD